MPLLHIEHPTSAAFLEQKTRSSEEPAQRVGADTGSQTSRPFQGFLVGVAISVPMWVGIIAAVRYAINRF